MPEPSLCVVIPTLGEEAAIGELVARLLGARGPGEPTASADLADRVIVADGGSGDRTCELARAAGAEVVEVARGRGTQLAGGAARAREDLLLFLHADTLPAAGALAAVRLAFARTVAGGGPGFAGLTQRVDAEGRFYRLIEGAANRRVQRGMVFGDSGLVCRRELYERVGGFRAIPLFEDVDLSRRLARASRGIRIEDAHLQVSARRWQQEGALRTTLRNWMLRMGYALGVRPERLAQFYGAHSAPERES